MDYSILAGPDIAHEGEYPERDSYQDVVLTERLTDALRRINPNVPMKRLSWLFKKLKRMNHQV